MACCSGKGKLKAIRLFFLESEHLKARTPKITRGDINFENILVCGSSSMMRIFSFASNKYDFFLKGLSAYTSDLCWALHDADASFLLATSARWPR